MDDGKPVDRPSAQSVRIRQGTGPRIMVSVLLISLLLAAIAGVALLSYYFFLAQPTARAIGL